MFPEGEKREEKEQPFEMSNRLQKKSEIESVYKKGKSFREGGILVKALKTDSGHPRFAFAISHKVSKKATVRNKLRRRLRNIIQDILKDKKASVDLLVIVFPGLDKKEYSELKEAAERIFSKI